MRISLSLIVCFVLVLGASVGASGQEGQAFPDLAVPADAEPFVGSEVCEWTYNADEIIEDVHYIVEHFSCTLETSDSRASGSEELDFVTRKGRYRALPWAATSELTTEEGSWSGSGEGMVDTVGVSPLGTRGQPFNYGEMTYVGEGANEGLVMHLYAAGGNDVLGVAGWIATAE